MCAAGPSNCDFLEEKEMGNEHEMYHVHFMENATFECHLEMHPPTLCVIVMPMIVAAGVCENCVKHSLTCILYNATKKCWFEIVLSF